MTQRRGNGLLADAYVPLILLAPTHADLMLEALRRSGIAAYAVPLEEDVLEPTGGQVEDPPTDHLYVDADERGAAEQVLGSELPDLGGSERGAESDLLAPRGEARAESEGEEQGQEAPAAHEGNESPVGGDLLDGPSANADPAAAPARPSGEDDVWNDLVARFYDDSEGSGEQRGRVAWPDAENLSVPDESQTRLGDILANLPRDTADDDEETREEDRRRAEAALEGHYEPPPPPPLLQGDRVGIAAWFGLLGGPVLLFGAAFLGISLPNWIMFLAVAAFLTSFVVLILRMTDARPPGDSGPDNGAVV